MTGFAVAGGRLLRDGQPFTAVGVDYHPSQAGAQLWTRWEPDILRRDFRRIAAAGLNTVRLFVYWRDFEPEPGRYRPEALARLRQAVSLAADAGLAGLVSLLTIWMNGQRLDLPWRHGRSLWRDAGMLARQESFAAEVGRQLRGLPNLLAVDLGDEIGQLAAGSWPELTRPEVAGWQARLAGALRRALPGVLVTQANDASGVLGSAPFGADNSAGLDLIAVHGFPTWSPGSIESTASYKASNLAPFLVRFAGGYGVPLVDELGSYGVDQATAAGHLAASAVSCLANGSAGVLAWCWQDISSPAEPFRQRPTERLVGLTRRDGTAKPALAALRQVAAAVPRLAGRRDRARIALYVPELARTGGSSYLDTEVGTLATFYAYLLLKRAHLDADLVTGDLATGDLAGYPLVICPSVTRVTLTDLDRFRAQLAAGGVLYYSMGDHLHGFPGADLAGVEIVDYSLLPEGREAIRWDPAGPGIDSGADGWPVDWPAGRATPVMVRATAGRSLAHFPDGSPAVQRHQVGPGTVLFCVAPFERQLDRPGRLTSRRWEELYRWVAGLAGIRPEVDCAEPDVELVPDRASRPSRVTAINHASAPRRVDLRWRREDAAGPDRGVPVDLPGKGWQVVGRPGGDQ